jgi:sugar-specific transcriptional regulator TrmB
MGLVEKNLTTTARYCAVPFPEAVKMLFEEKADELTLLSRKAERVTLKFSLNPSAVAVAEPLKPCFGVICEGGRGRKYSSAIQGTQGCLEVVSSWRRFGQLCFNFEAELKAALKRGVRMCVAVEKPSHGGLPRWVSTLDNMAFELRTMPNPPSADIAVFDGAKAAVAFDGTVRLSRGPDLWSVHPGLVAVCRGFFDRLWAALE